MDFTKYKHYVPLEKMVVQDNFPEYIVVHHTATKRDSFENIQRYHIIERGFENFGYHYYIAQDGSLRSGRPEWYHGGHTKEKKMNTKSIGVCLEGDFDIQSPTSKQISTLKKLLNELVAKYNIPLEKIVPHRHFAVDKNGAPYKSCFGSSLPDDWAASLIREIPKEIKIKKPSSSLKIKMKKALGKLYPQWLKLVTKK